MKFWVTTPFNNYERLLNANYFWFSINKSLRSIISATWSLRVEPVESNQKLIKTSLTTLILKVFHKADFFFKLLKKHAIFA